MNSGEVKSELIPEECKVCLKKFKRTKMVECNDCNLVFCKKHIKVNDNDFSMLCAECIKKRIHLEVSMENEEQILKAKSELSLLKKNLKGSKTEFAILEDKIERDSIFLNNSTEKHLEKITELQKAIEIAIQQNDDLEKNNKEPLLLIQEASEKLQTANKKYSQIENDRVKKMVELKFVESEVNKHIDSVRKNTELIPKYTFYSVFSKLACDACKSKIKKHFSEQIIQGNQGRNSLILSVMNGRMSCRQKTGTKFESIKAKDKEDEKCKCEIF